MLSVTLSSGDVVFPNGQRLRIRLDPPEPVASSGRIVVLHGDNGCGKTTVLKAISGVFRCFADDGRRPQVLLTARWSLGGVDREVTPRATKSICTGNPIRGGYLAQSVRANVFCRTVEDELAFSLEHSGLNPPETQNRLNTSIAEMAGLGIDAKKAPHALSKGQQQVLGIKSLVQADPDVLFLDEPSAALDECAT
ncbi:MAG: ATP-binding cassette domain-containing protein, partial [Candidatus Zixiibacteriota bacterium]